MKGVSAVIATILMLMITIALAGTAYLYITGIFGSKTSVNLAVDPSSSCTASAFTVAVRNDGTSVASNVKIDVTLPDGTSMPTLCSIANINAGGTNSTTCPVRGPSATNGFYGVRVYGGGATATGNIYCSTKTAGSTTTSTTTTGTTSGTTSTTTTTAPPGGTSFSSRRTMTINNVGNPNTLQNYAITAVVDTSSMGDCSTMRFADSTSYDYTTWPYNYSYYIPQGQCGSHSAQITVKFNLIPANQPKTIYLYYGGVTLPQFSSAKNTYSFFDDFSSDSTGSYTLYNQGGALPALTYNSPNANAYTSGNVGTGFEHIWYNTNIPDDVSISMAIKSDGDVNDCGQGISFFFDANYWLTADYGGSACAAAPGAAVQIKQSIGGSMSGLVYASVTHDTNWHIIRMDKIHNFVNISFDGSMLLTNINVNNFFDTSSANIGLDVRTGNSANEYWDNITASPFTVPQPTLS